MKNFFVIFFSWFFINIFLIPSVSAQATSADGLFGQYFQNMVKECSQPHHLVTGFLSSPYGTIVCKGVDEILGNITNGGPINIGKPGSNIHFMVNGKITQTQKPAEGDQKAVVTVELLEEILKKRLPKIKMGTDVMPATGPGMHMILFGGEPFATKPMVIAMPTSFYYTNKCKRDTVRWNTTVDPTHVTTTGFSVQKYIPGGCGGWTKIEAISYIAISNIGTTLPMVISWVPGGTESGVDDDESLDKISKLEKETEELKKKLEVASSSNDKISKLEKEVEELKKKIETTASGSTSTSNIFIGAIKESWPYIKFVSSDSNFSGIITMKTMAGEDIDLNFNKGSARWWMWHFYYDHGCWVRNVWIISMINKQTNKFVYFNDPVYYDYNCPQGW